MPIAVKCGKCGKGLKAPDNLAGKRVKCPGCSSPISVPAPPAAPAPARNLLDGLEDDLFAGGGLAGLDDSSLGAGSSLPPAGRSASAKDPLGPTPTRAAAAPKQDSRRMLIIGGSIGGGVVALLLIVGLIFMLSGDSPPENLAAVATPPTTPPATAPATPKPAAPVAANQPTGAALDVTANLVPPATPAVAAAPVVGAVGPPQSPGVVAGAPAQPAVAAQTEPAEPPAAAVPAQPAAPPAQLASVTPPAPAAPVQPAAPPVNRPPAAVNPPPMQTPPGAPVDPQQKAQAEKAVREQAKNIRQSQLALLAGGPETLVEKLRWAPAAKRPVLALRWGINLPVPQLGKAGGRPIPPKVADSEPAIVQAIGPAGTKLLAGLNERIAHGDFGGPPAPAAAPPPNNVPGQAGVPSQAAGPSQIAILPGDERGEVLAAARERGVDIVIMVDLKFQAALHHNKKGSKGGGGAAPKMTAILGSRIVDVAGGGPGWSSDSISNKKAADAEKDATEWANDNLEHIDEFKLQPIPDLDAKDVEKRMTDLEKKKLANPVAALLEVRYYQIKDLVPAERATAFYTHVLGDNGNLLASDDAKERQKALEGLPKP